MEMFKVGSRYAVTPGFTNECEIIALEGDQYRVRWSLKGEEQVVNAEFLKNLKPVINTKETMTFQFSQTQVIADQIAQLQDQLNALTASLQPYKECEEKANDLLQQVTQHGQLMRDKGIDEKSYMTWANTIYSQLTGVDINGMSEAVASLETATAERDEALTKIKNLEFELEHLNAINSENISKFETVKTQRDEALAKISNMTEASARVAETLKTVREENKSLKEQLQNLSALTDDMDSQLSESQLMPENEALRQENEELKQERDRLLLKIQELSEATEEEAPNTEIHSFEPDDIVQRQDGQVGTVSFAPKTSQGIISVRWANGTSNIHSSDLKLVSRPNKETLTHNFKEGDRVEVSTKDKELEDLNQRLGVVVGVKGVAVALLLDATQDEAQKEVVLLARHLKFISAKSPEIEAQNRGREFIQSIKSKAGMNNITWQNISSICQGEIACFREIHISAKTTLQIELTGKLSQLMADYIAETGDIADMQWIPATFKSKVEALLEAKKSFPYHSNDWVRVKESGDIWQVKTADNEWLSVKQGNRISTLHISEVELMPQQAA